MHQRHACIGEYTPLHITATATLAPVGTCVSTTGTTSVTAGSNVTITPTSIANIVPQMILNIANGTGTAEDVVVKSVNPTAGTFVADLQNSHSGAYTIISRRASYIGNLVVNQVGSGVTITLYNGHPSMVPDAGTAIAAIVPSAVGTIEFECRCSKGLFYTVAGTVGDYTLMYLDEVK